MVNSPKNDGELLHWCSSYIQSTAPKTGVPSISPQCDAYSYKEFEVHVRVLSLNIKSFKVQLKIFLEHTHSK